MPAHPIDFEIQAHVFSTPEMMRVFDEKTRFSRWLQFEAALARTQAELGIIPLAAAAKIEARADLSRIDLGLVQQGYQEGRNSLIPLLNGLRQACGDGYGEFVHYGATTQDVIDTAQVLEIKETLSIIYRDLRTLEAMLIEKAQQYKSVPMIGRTHGQQAMPITFGLKVAGWLAEVRRHLERIKSLAGRVLIGQLHGAVGTRAALGIHAREVAAKTLARLGLGCDIIGWHTARDNIAEVITFFALLTATLARIANEIFELSKTELGELVEPAPQKAMSSSTMPHKNNPVLCQRIIVLARHVRAQAGVVIEGMIHEHERDGRSLWAEWLAVPQASIYTGAALNLINQVLSGLLVRTDRMQENLLLQKEMVLSEWLLFRFAATMGKMRAQQTLHELFRKSRETGSPVQELIYQDPELGPLLDSHDLTVLKQPGLYIGQAEQMVGDLLAEITIKRHGDPEELSGS